MSMLSDLNHEKKKKIENYKSEISQTKNERIQIIMREYDKKFKCIKIL